MKLTRVFNCLNIAPLSSSSRMTHFKQNPLLLQETYTVITVLTLNLHHNHTGLYKQNFFQHKIVNIFLPIIFSIFFRFSKETSHRDGSFEYPQHMFWLRNKKFTFLVTKGPYSS